MNDDGSVPPLVRLEMIQPGDGGTFRVLRVADEGSGAVVVEAEYQGARHECVWRPPSKRKPMPQRSLIELTEKATPERSTTQLVQCVMCEQATALSAAFAPCAGAQRPHPVRGDWFCARGPGSKIQLNFYDAPPPDGVRIGGHSLAYQFLGPVHSSVASPTFTTVLVPHPELPILAWMNVWSYTTGYGVHYAFKVSRRMVEHWCEQGWENRFMAEQDGQHDEA